MGWSANLGFFRIGIACVGLAQLLLIWPNLLQLYGNFGFVQWAILETETDTWYPSIGKLCSLMAPFGLSSSACVYLVFSAYGIVLLGLLSGRMANLFGILSWALHSLTVNSGLISLYGVDTMLHICLFYCMWMPVGKAFVLGAKVSTSRNVPSFLTRISVLTLQIHLCIIYLNTALAKMSGDQWWNGEAIWRALMQPQFSVFDMSWLAGFPALAMVLCWIVLLVEGGYVLLIWLKPTRQLWLWATLFLHLGIALFMGLWLFSIIMMVMNIAAFGNKFFK